METGDTQNIIDRIDKSNEKQAKYARAQFLLSVITVLVSFAALIAVLLIVPQVREATDRFKAVSAEAIELSEKAEVIMDEMKVSVDNIEVITDDLAKSDIEGMVGNVNDLAVTSQEKMTDALEKLDKIDFEQLNTAIKNLSDVIEPLAKFFNVLHG